MRSKPCKGRGRRSASWGEHAGSPAIALKLTITRGGGLAGLTRQTEVASDALSPGEDAKLRELVEGSGLLGEAAPKEAPPAHPDEMSYEVTVEHEGRAQTRRFTEQTLPDSVRSLIAWADSRARR
jgi:Emfourin